MEDSKEDQILTFKKLCTNFNKMTSHNKNNEIIKIQYWKSTEKKIDTLKLESSIIVDNSFKYILFENKEIIQDPKLFNIIIFYLRKKNEEKFVICYFEYMLELIKYFEKTEDSFINYLLYLSISIYSEFKNLDNSELKKNQYDFFNKIIFRNSMLFESTFINFIYTQSHSISIFLNDENSINIILSLINNLLEYYEFENVVTICQLIQTEKEAINNKFFSLYYNKLITCIINKTYCKIYEDYEEEEIDYFHHNYFYALLSLIFSNYKIIEKNENFEIFLIKSLEYLLFFGNGENLHKNLFMIYNENNHKLFSEIFPIYLYLYSENFQTFKDFELLNNYAFQNFNIFYKNLIYNKFILKNQETFLLKEYSFTNVKITNLKTENKNEKLELFELKEIDSINYQKDELSQIFLMRLLIKQSFKITENNEIIINPSNLYHILKHILALKKYSKSFFNNFSYFILDLLAVLLNACMCSGYIINKKLISLCFDFIGQRKKSFQNDKIYPRFITLIQKYIFKDISYFTSKESQFILIESFNYLNKFARETEKADFIFKFLITIFKKIESKDDFTKTFISEYLSKLCVKANDLKLFNAYFKWIENALSKKGNDNKFINHSLYLYCKNYEGSLSDQLLNYLFEQLKEFLSNHLKEEFRFNDKFLLIISSFHQVYLKDRPNFLIENLNQLMIDGSFNSFIIYCIKQTKSVSFNDFFNENNDINAKSINDINHFFDYSKFSLLSEAKQSQDYLKVITYKYFCKIYAQYIDYFLDYLNNNYNEDIINENNKEKETNDNEEEENFDYSKYPETSKQIKLKVEELFAFIYSFLTESNQSSIFFVILLNEFFSKQSIYDYFFGGDTQNLANNEIKRLEADFSLLSELEYKINSQKMQNIFQKIHSNSYFYLFAKNIIFKFLSEENNKFQEMNTKIKKKYEKNFNEELKNKNSIIKNMEYINEKEKEKFISDQENHLFTLYFFKNILKGKYNSDYKVLYLLLLEDKRLHKYILDASDYISIDLLLQIFYSFIHQSNKLNESFTTFIDILAKRNLNHSIFSFLQKIFLIRNSIIKKGNDLIPVSYYNCIEIIILKYLSFTTLKFKFCEDIINFFENEKITLETAMTINNFSKKIFDYSSVVINLYLFLTENIKNDETKIIENITSNNNSKIKTLIDYIEQKNQKLKYCSKDENNTIKTNKKGKEENLENLNIANIEFSKYLKSKIEEDYIPNLLMILYKYLIKDLNKSNSDVLLRYFETTLNFLEIIPAEDIIKSINNEELKAILIDLPSLNLKDTNYNTIIQIMNNHIKYEKSNNENLEKLYKFLFLQYLENCMTMSTDSLTQFKTEIIKICFNAKDPNYQKLKKFGYIAIYFFYLTNDEYNKGILINCPFDILTNIGKILSQNYLINQQNKI